MLIRCLLAVVMVLTSSSVLQSATFTGKTLDGQHIQVPLKEQKPVLLVFWASWCGSCAKEAPIIAKLHGELNDRIRIIGINVDEDLAAAKAFISNKQLPYANITDADLRISEILHVKATPSLVLLDGQGNALKQTKGLNQELVSALRTILRQQKSTSNTTTKKTKPRTQVFTKSPQKVVEEHAAIMGTDIHVLIHTDDNETAHKAIAAAFAEMKRVDDSMTDWRPIGQVWKINQAAGKHSVSVSPELITLIKRAKEISTLSDGLFDISYRGVGKLWHFNQENPQLPDPQAITAGLALVGHQHINIDEANNSVLLEKSGMEIGLGGIAKGYAVDSAVKIVEGFGFKNFVVNAGGDLYVRGTDGDDLWHVGIKHPRQENQIIAEVPAKNYAIVTSGDYERFMVIDGKRYAHIINPRTGYPANACQSVTVLAKHAMDADALSTSIFLLGPEKGLALAESLEGVETLLVDANGDIHMSSGFKP